MTAGPEILVTIAVLTFRRPDDLAELLPLLLAQAAENEGAGRRVDVLVVDNDAAAGGRPVVAALGDERIRYVVEETPGISAARNRALEEAGGAFLVFIDDDERPHPGWLARLLETQARTSAAAVVGAVVSDFDGDLDPWVGAGGFFERRRLATGTPITVAATNNLLLDLAVVRSTGVRFDGGFGLTGGSDTLFTRQLTDTGALMVWCDEAVVTDRVPAPRMSRDWVVRRSFRYGNTAARVALVLAPTGPGRLAARLKATAQGLPRVAVGLGRWLLGATLRSSTHEARGARTAARGAGMLAGAVGVVYAEYRRKAAA
ncbi:Glycosyl transferase family 2 [Blastococcus aurantiacus]|uniref:Glycosyl transferase family 2 n=1 Tax=Blastococcus aurantiacus TaxID=1550231 RepID=A0A1G7JPW8_9ACTN|nr:glycosyltransferase family 2 protein [Blastococcus aurantiacus]SDF26963.1 Glycosyl transferase family 2 [Blastococcus aurantiacus]